MTINSNNNENTVGKENLQNTVEPALPWVVQGRPPRLT